MAQREQLPDDGARYRCGFGFTQFEDWRCNKNATHALTHDTLARYTGSGAMGRHVVIHGRAMRDTHLDMIESSI